MNIRKIIKEEINRFILESVNPLQQLERDAEALDTMYEKLTVRISKMTNASKELDDLIFATEYFTVQLIDAINRCVRNNNINESLADYGIYLPSQLRNLDYSFRRGYNNTKRFLNRNFRGGGNSKYGTAYQKDSPMKSRRFNKNSVSQKRLGVLLNDNFNNLKQKYNRISGEANQQVPEINSIIRYVEGYVIPNYKNAKQP